MLNKTISHVWDKLNFREKLLINFKRQQNEKPTQMYPRTTWEGSAMTIQGLGKISIKGL